MEVDLLPLILNNGVAVGVMVYFLISIKPTIDKNTEMLGRIAEKMEKCPIVIQKNNN